MKARTQFWTNRSIILLYVLAKIPWIVNKHEVDGERWMAQNQYPIEGELNYIDQLHSQTHLSAIGASQRRNEIL